MMYGRIRGNNRLFSLNVTACSSHDNIYVEKV